MIETDSYLYIANNDRDDAGSDEHNSKHIHPHFTFTFAPGNKFKRIG